MEYNKEASYYLNGNEKRSKFPSDFNNLKKQIKELFSLDDERLNYYDIIYQENGKKIYIINDDTFNIPKLTSFSVVFIIVPKYNIKNFISKHNINKFKNETYFYNIYQNKRGRRGNWGRRGERGNWRGRQNWQRGNRRGDWRRFDERGGEGQYQENNYRYDDNIRNSIINQRENYNNNNNYSQLHNDFNDNISANDFNRNNSIFESKELINLENQLNQNNNINLINAPLIENYNNFINNEIEESNENNIIFNNEEVQYEEEIEFEKIKIKEDFYNKYLSIIEQMEILFEFMISQEDIINIVKNLLSSPYLTIFEAMNLILREAQIIKTLFFINTEKRDFKGNTSNESDNLEVVRKYKIFPKSKTLQKHWLFIDDSDKRRVLVKDENGYYNYIPLLNLNNKEDKYNLYAKNENEVLYHYLFYKTLLCKECDLSKINEKENELCPYAHNILKDFRIIYNNKDEKIIKFMQLLLNYSNLFHFKDYIEYLQINSKLNNAKINNCPYNEKCKNNPLCPFFHESIKEEKLNENIIDEEVEKIKEIKEIKEKINKCVFVGKGLICRKCNILPNDSKICFFIKCNHFLCYKCFKMQIEKKENKKNPFLKCPFCRKKIKKNEIALLNF